MHMNIGEPAKKLHTARSRNNKFLSDFRLWCHDAIDGILVSMKQLQDDVSLLRSLPAKFICHADAEPVYEGVCQRGFRTLSLGRCNLSRVIGNLFPKGSTSILAKNLCFGSLYSTLMSRSWWYKVHSIPYGRRKSVMRGVVKSIAPKSNSKEFSSFALHIQEFSDI